MVKNNNIEDIFDEVDTTNTPKSKVVAKPSIKNMPQNQVSVPNSSPVFSPKKSSPQFIVLIIFIVLVLIGMVYLVVSGIFGNNENTNQADLVVNTNSANINVTNVNSATNQVSTISLEDIDSGPLDSDRDGLTDEEESTLGTNKSNIDSDSDGLFDREEVMVYKTNPLKNDSDGDGNLDGEEVDNGYNPNGPGLLLDLKNSIDNLQ